MIKISIIVPIFQVRIPFLRECIEGLMAQTLKEIEIILIDDGSEDDCGNICDEYASFDERIRVIHQENQGVSVARNVGIRMARGEWITFVDADDTTELTMCEEILRFAERNNADIAMFSNYVHEDHAVYEHPFFQNDIISFTETLREEFQLRTMILCFPHCSFQPQYMLIGHTFGKLIKKEYLLNNNILFNPELRLQQDGIFYLYLSECGGKMAYLNKPLYHYRVYDTSNCKKIRTDAAVIYSKIRQAFMDFILKNHKQKIYYDVFYSKCVSDISQNIKNDFFDYMKYEPLYSRLRRLKSLLQEEPFKTAINKADKKFLPALKRRNLFYYRYNLLFILWLDWKIYDFKKNRRII
jgi:glycosyltransferase involved in cell wall biosynthesis